MSDIEANLITAAQEAPIYTQLERDDELWMVFFAQYIRARCESDETLVQGIVDHKLEWQAEVERIKKDGFDDIKEMCHLKPLQWNMRIKRLLSNPNQVTLLRLNLRALAGLRTRKNKEANSGGNVRKQTDQIVSALANEIYPLLDPYFELTRCLERNMTPSGKDLTDVSRSYYQNKQNDHFTQIVTYLGMIILIKGASSRDEVNNCQAVMRRT